MAILSVQSTLDVSVGGSRYPAEFSDPWPVNAGWELVGLDIQKLAAEGYFRALAFWLNEHLVPHRIYAQVMADELPGRLKILVEFERAPQPERLVRFVCDRLYKLNSEVIEGIRLIARAMGSAKTDWEQSIRIPTASQRRARQAAAAAEPQLLHESARTRVARAVLRDQFPFFRAALMTGTAAAAFFFGGFTELLLSGHLTPASSSSIASSATQSDDYTPWYAQEPSTTALAGEPADFAPATEVSFRPASRFEGRTVEGALETVAVIPHEAVANPEDPTISLVFGGELDLDDFTFAQPDSLDQLFNQAEVYRQADVAMVGLAEPLATASTSLQEDFYHRTRPQAVKTLKAGGIDIVSLAGEGTLTYGARGLGETFEVLDREGIFRVGAGRNQQEAHRPEILEVKGQRIAYLGYNPEAIKGAKAEKAGVALATGEERQHIIEDIRAIRSQVDWVVVNYRWGDSLDAADRDSGTSDPASSAEGAAKQPEQPTLVSGLPADWQRTLAHEAVDAGADLVVGYHPSQIQGAEIYRDRAIAYSLGDFVFSGAPFQDHDTAALRVSLRNQQMKVEFLPITIRDSQIQMATGDRGSAILQAIREASKGLDQPLRFPMVLQAQPQSPAPPLKRSPSPVFDEVPDGALDRDLDTPLDQDLDKDLNRDLDKAWQESLEEKTLLKNWGDAASSAFEPIPQGQIQRQRRGDEPAVPNSEVLGSELLETVPDEGFSGQFPTEMTTEVPHELPEALPAQLSFESAPDVPIESSGLESRGLGEQPLEQPVDEPPLDNLPLDEPPLDEPPLDELPTSQPSMPQPSMPEPASRDWERPTDSLGREEPLELSDPLNSNYKRVPEGSIAPYEEPLVGPLSTLPNDNS